MTSLDGSTGPTDDGASRALVTSHRDPRRRDMFTAAATRVTVVARAGDARDAERATQRVERPACAKARDEGEVGARVDMAKAKCVHPDRPVAKACGDCPRRK